MTGIRPTAEDKHRYTTGCCYDLALEIHKRTGWALLLEDWEEGVTDYYWDGFVYPVCPSHALVVTPDGRKLDIDGVRYCDGINRHGEEILAEALVDAELMATLPWAGHDPDRTAGLAEYLIAEARR